MNQPHFDGIQGDADDEIRRAQVAPRDWINPTPQGRYHLVVIGAGTAGLVTAAGAAGLGAKVALIERGAMGGDCLNVGCVPSKALLASARRARLLRSSDELGIVAPEPRVEFDRVMQRMRRLRADISPHDSAQRFRKLGVDVFFGNGTFASSNTISVDGQTALRFRKAVIATGARAAVPPIPGLQDAGYLTNETLFRLTERPQHLIVIGGGPIGCEMAQAFANFGSQVTLVDQGNRILSREPLEASEIIHQRMKRDGVEIRLQTRVNRVEANDRSKRVVIEGPNGTEVIEGDQLLVAVGRAPNVSDLELERVGVQYDPRKGVSVDSRLRTSNPRIFAAGDICSAMQFTHAADFQARTVIRNALFLGRAKHTSLLIPRCTYTFPEVASVGMNEAQAQEAGYKTRVFEIPFSSVDRAILEGETEGFVRVVCRSNSDKILGATIVSENAGDLISPLVLAMNRRIGLSKIGSVIHAYPTRAEAIRRLGDQYSRTRLTATVKTLFGLWLKWTG